MSCSHKRVWEMEDTGKEDIIKELLKDGYEPFGCFREKRWEYGVEEERTIYCFKRQKPCEECAKTVKVMRGFITLRPGDDLMKND